MKAFMVDLDRCVGCYACIISCKDENNLDPRTDRLSLKVIQGKEELYTYYVPEFNQTGQGESRCTTCPQLQAKGKQPACVANCLTDAILFDEPDQIKKATAGRHVKTTDGKTPVTYVSSNKLPE